MRRERPALFEERHFEPEIIILCVRRYLRYALSLRSLEEIMAERNVHVDHVTIWRWIQSYAPELSRRCRPVRYLNNLVEQDHRAIKRRVRAMQGFRSFHSACERSRVSKR